MVAFSSSDVHIAIIGLGYVGLPLALALARHYPVIGFDTDGERLADLKGGEDRTGEISPADLEASSLAFAARSDELANCNLFIVTVPTPIDEDNTPDLSALVAASRDVGAVISTGCVVVFESTVYPGATEDVCGPEIERASGMVCGEDFFLGYSPERINPGDKEHTIDRITKVVAGQTPKVAALLRDIYGGALYGGVHVAPDIRTAEAAKVIENAQRDINIAFINEVTMIFQRLGLDTQAVLAAARTKWNFLDFQPGLVGGHCIGVDPFYLAHAARIIGHDPEVILSGRRINDSMAIFAARRISAQLPDKARVLVLGLTFKENVTDLRNSKIADLIDALKAGGHTVDVHDAVAHPAEARLHYGIELIGDLSACSDYDGVVGAVQHDAYRDISAESLLALIKPDGLLADIKGMWRHREFGPKVRYWQL